MLRSGSVPNSAQTLGLTLPQIGAIFCKRLHLENDRSRFGELTMTTLPEPSDLTEKMRSFAEHYVQMGGQNATEAARRAGYAASGAQAVSSRMLRDPRILDYLKWLAETRMRAGVIKSVQVLEKIRDDDTVAPDVRRKAAESLLDRGGLLLTKLHEHRVEITETRDGQIAEILRLCRTQNIDPAALGLQGLVAFVGREKAERLAAPRNAIDAEFSEDVEPEPEAGRRTNLANVERIADESGQETRENPLADDDDLSDLL
jgi:hypothetical protein